MIFDELEKFFIPESKKKNFYKPLPTICLLIIFIYIGKIIYKYISDNDNKIIATLIIIFIIYLVLLFANEHMKTNIKLTEKFSKPEDISNDLNTGDIVTFRCYEYDDFGWSWFGLSIPLLQKFYCTHIGIIYKDPNGKVYIFESNGDRYYCELSKKVKSGTALMNFNKRINQTKVHRVHVFKNNLHKFIDNNKFFEIIKKYKDHKFNQDNIYCIKLVVNILIENGVLKDENLLHYLMDDLVDPKNYKVPVKFEEPIKVREPDFYWL